VTYFEDREPRLIGLDYGTVRCGMAIADPSGTLASPFAVIETKPLETLGNRVLETLGGKPALKLIVGLPLELKGNEGEAAKNARMTGELIVSVIGCPVEYIDERFTTAEMHNARKAAGKTGKQRQKDIDAWAAAAILQSYIDREKMR